MMNRNLMNIFRRAWRANPLDTENELLALNLSHPHNRYGEVLTYLRAEVPMTHKERILVTVAGRAEEELASSCFC